jgi:hypothetical protein
MISCLAYVIFVRLLIIKNSVPPKQRFSYHLVTNKDLIKDKLNIKIYLKSFIT